MIIISNNILKITIDKELVHKYNLYYMKIHPKAKNIPFAKKKTEKVLDKNGNPTLTKGGNPKTKTKSRTINDYSIDDCLYGTMSLNEILVINDRLAMNNVKEKWGNLGKWIAKEYDLCDKGISNSLIEYKIYSLTKANKDLDNLVGGIKILNDGLLVQSGMYIDDNFNHINPLIIVGDYDKENPRTEIKISIFDDEVKDVYEKIRIHLKNFE